MSKWIHKFELKPGSWVFVPDEESRRFGSALKRDLQDKWKIPPYYSHLLPGGHVAALKAHIKHKIFMRADIQNFFGRIGLSRVTRALNGLNDYKTSRTAALQSVVRCPDDISRTILPFGFIQSPILASLCMRKSKLGGLLEELNRSSDLTVSVYVDDIIVSTNRSPIFANEVFSELCGVAQKSGFGFGPNKLEPPTERISAFNISLAHNHMEIEQPRLEVLAYDALSTDSGHVYNGISSYVHSISSEQGESFDRVLADNRLSSPTN